MVWVEACHGVDCVYNNRMLSTQLQPSVCVLTKKSSNRRSINVRYFVDDCGDIMKTGIRWLALYSTLLPVCDKGQVT